jgi:hypothetical protein
VSVTVTVQVPFGAGATPVHVLDLLQQPVWSGNESGSITAGADEVSTTTGCAVSTGSVSVRSVARALLTLALMSTVEPV